MKPLLLVSCMLTLGALSALAAPSAEIPFFHRHKKTAAADAPTEVKPKAKRSLLHRAQPTREEQAHAEATYGMTGPRSVGRFHPEPGPAGVGAK
jgi:hypothetical protein